MLFAVLQNIQLHVFATAQQLMWIEHDVFGDRADVVCWWSVDEIVILQ